jgi:hypothetical protein
MTRAEIIASTRCPRCGAPPGMPCQQAGRRRDAAHAARVGLAEMTAAWRTPRPGPGQVKSREKWRASRYGHR